jgi:hypothetical protein
MKSVCIAERYCGGFWQLLGVFDSVKEAKSAVGNAFAKWLKKTGNNDRTIEEYLDGCSFDTVEMGFISHVTFT